MRLRTLVLGSAALMLLSACSGPAEPVRTTEAAQPSAASGQAPFLTTDCALAAAPVPSESEPSGQPGLDGVFVEVGEAAPKITIAANAQASRELQYLDPVVGTGAAVAPGDSVVANYCGVGMTSRTMFDSSWVRGGPIEFSLDQVIQGWSIGLQGMKMGGGRLLVIPAELAYGANPRPGILPNEALVFYVELVSVT